MGGKYNIMETCTEYDGHSTQSAMQWRCTTQQTTMNLTMEMNCACKVMEYNQRIVQCNGD